MMVWRIKAVKNTNWNPKTPETRPTKLHPTITISIEKKHGFERSKKQQTE